jgi:hypothetical protein
MAMGGGMNIHGQRGGRIAIVRFFASGTHVRVNQYNDRSYGNKTEARFLAMM